MTIYEKESFVGGLSSTEIPSYRLPYDVVAYEVKLATDLGVKVEYGKALGVDFTVESLKADGAEAVFVGIGLPDPRTTPAFEGLTPDNGFWTSKDFLPIVMKASKTGLCGDAAPALPQVSGHVLVLGAGDTVCGDVGVCVFFSGFWIGCPFRCW